MSVAIVTVESPTQTSLKVSVEHRNSGEKKILFMCVLALNAG